MAWDNIDLGDNPPAIQHAILGEMVGIAFIKRGEADPHVTMLMLSEDDGRWYWEHSGISSYWAEDALIVHTEAVAWLKANCDPDPSGFGWIFPTFTVNHVSGSYAIAVRYSNGVTRGRLTCNSVEIDSFATATDQIATEDDLLAYAVQRVRHAQRTAALGHVHRSAYGSPIHSPLPIHRQTDPSGQGHD